MRLIQHTARFARLVIRVEAFFVMPGGGCSGRDNPECEYSVGQDEFVIVFGMFEAIDEAFFGRQAGKESKVGFPAWTQNSRAG